MDIQENRSARKIDIVAQTLKQKYPILEILAIGNRYEEYMHIHSDCLNYMPLIVSTVDTDTTRKNIQANLPKKIINGWTETEGSILSYGVGVHEFLNEYECLNCVYFPKTAPSDQIEFYSIRTGLTVEDVKKRLKEKIPTTDKDIEFISKKKGVPIDSLMQFIGKPLDELIHGQCGLFSIPIQGKPATASVPHIPLLVALHLATQLLIPNLERTPEIKPIESAAVFNGLGIPNIKNLELRKKEPRCICSDLIYQEAYKEKWGI